MKFFTTLLITLFMAVPASAVITGTVNAQATHGFLFSWNDPVERTDSTPLSVEEIFGYRLRCESEQEQAEIEIVVADTALNGNAPLERSYWWDSAVQRGGWYDCKMTAIDVEDLESDWSNVVAVRRMAQPRPPNFLRGR